MAINIIQKKSSALLAATCLALSWANFAFAVDLDREITFKISSQSLSSALVQFGEQAKLQILTANADLNALKTSGVQGKRTVRAALTAILAGTNLSFREVGEGTLTIGKHASTDVSSKKITGLMDSTDGLDVTYLAALDTEVADVPDDSKKKTKNKARSSSKGGVEEMIVEDSKIKPFSDANADLPRTVNDPQPYYIYDSKTIERSGALTVQDFLRQRLTMDTTFEAANEVFPTTLTGADPNSALDREGLPGGSTMSSFNLRGLGSSKTLILVNGRQLPSVTYSKYETVYDLQPNVNGISLASIDRIEVLPSSASAIYGSNAIGGVINIILKRNFKGGDVRLTYDTPSNSGASTSTASASYGFSLEGGKTQVMASASFSTSKPMLLGDRAEFMQRGLDYFGRKNRVAENDPVAARNLALSYRASMGPTGTYLVWYGATDSGLALKDGTVVAPNLITTVFQGVTYGSGVAYVKPGTSYATPLAQRFAPFGPEYLTPSPGYGPWGLKQPLGSVGDVKSINLTLTREMNTWLELFTDLQFNENSSETLYIPGQSINLGENNSLNPGLGNVFRAPQVFIGSTGAHPIPLASNSQTRSFTGGVRAHFQNGWSGELSYALAKNLFDRNGNQPDSGRVTQDVWEGLVDLLVDPFTVDLDLSKYNSGGMPNTNHTRSDEIALRAAGPVFRLPWGEPKLSIGLQRTKPSMPGATSVEYYLFGSPVLGFVPQIGDIVTYYPRSTTNDAFYFEGLIPLITDKNAMPLLRGLDIQVAQRFSRSIAEAGTVGMNEYYNTAGALSGVSYFPRPIDAVNGYGGTPVSREANYKSNNGTIAFKYEPLPGLTLRASVGTAFIPPTYSQLIADQKLTPNGATITSDPVTGLVSYRANLVSGGNPDLKPQRSESRDIGVIYQPQSGLLRGLRVNLQHYTIGQFDFIATPSLTEVLRFPDLASRVIRDPVTSMVTQVDLSLTNITERSSSGIDATFGYEMSNAWGNWDVSLGASKIAYERRQATLSSSMVNYAGYPGYGGPTRYKANANFVWGMRRLTLGWTTNWSGSYRVAETPGDPVNGYRVYSGAAWVLQGSFSVPSQMYHSLFVGYDFGKDARIKMLSGVGLQLNIQNVLNKVPPFDVLRPPFYMSSLGSYRLRAYMLSVKKSF